MFEQGIVLTPSEQRYTRTSNSLRHHERGRALLVLPLLPEDPWRLSPSTTRPAPSAPAQPRHAHVGPGVISVRRDPAS